MKEQFTQGEWVVDDSGDVIIKGSRGGVGCPASEGTIASLNDGEYIENTNEHDAHLIAASPEMYRMIKVLISNYESANIIAEMEGYETRYAQDAELVKLLLAKARGITPPTT